MATALNDILSWTYLTGVIQGIEPGLPDRLPKAFWNLTEPVIGNTAKAYWTEGVRTVPVTSAYGSPSVNRSMIGIQDKPVALLHTHESMNMNPLTFQNLANYTNYDRQNMGKLEVDRQLDQFAQRFKNLRIASLCSMLVNGKIWFDSSGNLLPSASGAADTIDYGVPAGNRNQLDVFGTGAIISASWATASTAIDSQIRALKAASVKQTGKTLKYAFYGQNIPSYFATNTSAQTFLSRNAPMNSQYLNQVELPHGLFALTWLAIYEMFFEDASAVLQSQVGVDTVVFTPEIDRRIYTMYEGSYLVPTTFQPQNNIDFASMTHMVYGMGSYATLIDDPITAKQHHFDTFLPWWKIPKAMYIADVTP